MSSRPRLAASLTAADPLALGDCVRAVLDAGVDVLHVDLGDGAFVPWLGGSIELVEALAHRFRVPVEVHLMVTHPEDYIAAVAEAGASGVICHVEAMPYPRRIQALASRCGVRLAMAVNPATAVACAEPYLGVADRVTLLTTEPDAAGELLLPGSTARVRELERVASRALDIEVDGGVTLENAPALLAAGASALVVGRALTGSADPAAAVAQLRSAASTQRAS